MSTIVREPYPESKKLSKSNVTMWKHYMGYQMMDWPDLGSAINTKVKFIIEKPNRHSVWSGTTTRRYTINPTDIIDFDAASTERWAHDMDRYTDALAALKKDEAQFCSFIRSSFSEDAHILLRSDPRYNAASTSSSSYDLFMICLELHSCSNSFSVALSTLVSLFASPWPGSLNQLKDDLLNSRNKVSAMFDPTGTGTIKIDDLYVVALLNALPDKHFSYPKDKIFAKNNIIPDFFRTLETMTNFDNYKTTLSLESASSATPAGPTALAVVTPTPSTSTSTCVLCQKPFPTVISRESQKPFRYCFNCNNKRREQLNIPSTVATTNPATRPPPTPAARPPTQKQIQIAHAVFLAASAAAPPVAPPAAVTPLTYDAAYLNSFVQSNGLNILSATSPSTNPEPLWYMDSGASLTCTFDILDLANPVLLPETLPIGSADGGIIYATDRGHSHLSPLIPVHFLPPRRSDPQRIHLQRQTGPRHVCPRPSLQTSLYLRSTIQQRLDLPATPHGPKSHSTFSRRS